VAAAAGAERAKHQRPAGADRPYRSLPACRFVIDCNDDRFINPANMSAEIQAACRESGQPVPGDDAELARCIFDSLACSMPACFASWPNCAASRSASCILSAAAARTAAQPAVRRRLRHHRGRRPVEASTLGNIGIQLMTLDELNNVDDFRQVVRATPRSPPLPPILNMKLPVSWRSFSHNRLRSFAHDHST
jgi:sugar (pentulose or hexulose) kinase